MKKLLLSILLCPLFSFAQTIPEKANLITVLNTATAYANFTDVRLLLTKKGIEIANLDKDTFDIKTGLIDVKDSGHSYYEFFCRDHQIFVSGKYKDSNGNITAITNSGIQGSATKLRFEAMNELVKLLGKKLQYEVSKYYQ